MPELGRTRFCLSTPHHGMQGAPDEGLLALGQQQLTHLLHLPHGPLPQQHGSSAAATATAALPSRYYTTNPGFLFPQRSEVPKQAFGFAPVFHLARCCSSTSSAGGAATLSHESVVALRPTSELAHLPAAAAAAALVVRQSRLQQQQQRDLCQPPPPPQQQQKRKARQHRDEGVWPQQQQQASGVSLPWLGAQLDVGGYTKRGFISGGGKDQNQDRGLILESFRSPSELLLGVMDGHGTSGHLVSTYLAQHLPAVLMQKLLAAAAAVGGGGSSDGEPPTKQRRLFGKQRQQPPPQQQQQGPDGDLQFGVSQVPYVVVPDHWPKYGLSAGQVHSSSSSSSSSGAAADGTASPQPVHTAGRAVVKQQLVQQLRSHPLGDEATTSNSSSPSSSNSPSSSSSFSASSSQKWLSPVSHASVVSVPLSQELLSGAFTATDFLLSGSGINVVDSGSTALLCHVGPHSITTAWVGDSRAVLGRRKQLLQSGPTQQQQQQQQLQQELEQLWGPSGSPWQQEQQQQQQAWEAIPLSVDHKPDRDDENLRINLNEGRVAQIMGRGPYRVWFKGIDYPGLAMSRAFGDLPCRRIGVTVEPEVTVHPLRPEDQLLVAATDGIWDVLTNEEVVALAGSASAAGGAAAAARALCEVAEARWFEAEGGYVDDMTAVVVRARVEGKQ